MIRGEVYYVDFPFVFGSEQGGNRPCVVIQNDIGNIHSGTTIIAPMTTQTKKRLPTHVPISSEDKPLHPSTIILLEQIRVVDKQRVGNYVCRLSDETMERVDKAIEISLALHKEERSEKAVNELKVFNNEELGLEVRTILNDDGSISVNAEDTAKGFGWIKSEGKNGKIYKSIRWDRMNGFSAECGFDHEWSKDDYIPESLFYRLGMKANNAVAEKFQNWLALEVIPSIRKTGGYQQKRMTPEEMMRIQLGMIDGIGGKVESLNGRVENLENTMNIDYGQQRVLEKEVASVVIESLGGKDSNAYVEMSKKVFSECNRDVKDYFHVNSRNNIPRIRFDDAVEYIRQWMPCTNTKVAIRDCNAQMSI